ncbi:MAG: 50S ribosome-binding GTPase [Proteobacteria bacterium]|nr:50S ribosome-binding GTPase [Pseudomonadota bacterium]
MTISTRPADAIKALGRIEGFKNDVRLLRATIDQAPLWRPGAALKKQCDEVLRIMTDLEARFDRKLVVTLIGPCGSGKSTLLNALAGVDDLSEVGNRRPTTTSVVLLGREKKDADPLNEELGTENVKILTGYAASALEHVLLIDTPDTDSNEQEKHMPIVKKAIALSDILVCVFDAENPKRRDHVDFLAPYVRLFSGDSLVGVINKCDRQDQHELIEKILPEFLNFINKAWDKPVPTVLCISARRHLHHPGWDPEAMPRNDFDQFEKLHQMIFGTFNRPGYVIDRRLKNAANLRDYVYQEAGSEAGTDLKALKNASEQIRKTEKTALKDALTAFRHKSSGQLLGVNVLLYQKLAHRWLGPVGWLVAVWARILILSTGMVSVFRFGNPLRQMAGVVSSLKHFKDAPAASADTERTADADSALGDYRLAVMQHWPDIAEDLVKTRFDLSVRKIENMLPEAVTLNQDLAAIWRNSLDNAVENASRSLSGFMLQFLFNLPVIAILGHAGWITVRNYFNGTYLPSDFFWHALLTIGIILFLVFFILQGCVRLAANTERIAQKAFEQVKVQLEQLQPLSLAPVSRQIETVQDLAELCSPEH